jgi:hypothetical protein
MTRVTVLKDESDDQAATYRAVGGHAQAMGRTAGEAVDALAAQLPEDQATTLLIVRDLRADRFFPEERRRRLDELMVRWRAARDSGTTLSAEELAELQRLVDEEVQAAADRAAEAWRELAR